MKPQSSPVSRVIAVKKFRKDRNQEHRTSHWENEVRVLEKIKYLGHDHIVRFLTAFRHGEGRSLDHYICFEWAGGGNLFDLWNEDPQPRLSASLIRAAIQQMDGLAQALKAIHYFKGSNLTTTEASLIHGDIKPKNILWFRDGGEIGTLKLGDWGEARLYGDDDSGGATTATRNNNRSGYGTRRYEPPEVETGLDIGGSGCIKNGRSRLYDTWSFGCLTLEFIIWLLHGMQGLENFHHANVGDYGLSDSFYEINHERIAKVHGVVSHWMEHLGKDALCQYESSGLGDLLDIVRNGLLVVKLPQGGGSTETQIKSYSRFMLRDDQIAKGKSSGAIVHETVTVKRAPVPADAPSIIIIGPVQDAGATSAGHSCGDEDRLAHRNNVPAVSEPDLERFRAIELVENLDRLRQRAHSDSYWFKDLPRCPMPPKFRGRASLSKIPVRVRGNYEYPDLDPENWQIRPDNDFAASIFERLVNSDVLSSPSTTQVTSHLCDKCHEFEREIWSPFFSMTYETKILYQNAASHTCDLCALLSQVCQDNDCATHSSVKFERRNSTVRMSNIRLPVLSLFRNYGELS